MATFSRQRLTRIAINICLASVLSLSLINIVRAQETIEQRVSTFIKKLKDKDPRIRSDAAAALAGIGAEARAAVPELINALKDEEPVVRYRATIALGNIGPEAKAAIPELINALKDKDSSASGLAASALGRIGPAAVPELINALKNEDSKVRRGAAAALTGIGAEARAAVPELINALKDEDPIVRLNVAIALGSVGPEAKDAIPALINALKDKDSDVRLIAAGTLGGISIALYDAKATDALPILRDAYTALLESEDPEVNKRAKAVKRTIDYLESLGPSKITQWIYDHTIISIAIIALPALLLIWLALLWLRPLWLLRVNEAIPDSTDIKLPDWLGGIKLSLRYVILVGFFRYHSRVLNAWVAKYVGSARQAFSAKPTVEAREVHIPVPVVLNGENTPNVTADDLRPVFSKNLSCLLLWGEGGAGKTSLTCLIAKWAMSEEKDTRLCKGHLMLPVLIEQDLEPKTGNGEDPFLRIINNQLKALIDAVEPIPAQLLRHLLKRRRVLIIVDGLSEMNEVSRANILGGVTDFSVNAVIFTSRTDESLNNLPKNTIKPLRIKGGRLSTFMEAYLTRRKKRDLFEDEEFFEACGQLSRMVGDRDVTTLLAKLYAEQMIASKEEATNDDSPDNIPDLMLKYIYLIYGKPVPNAPDIRVTLGAAKIIAWECLKKTYRPMPARREDVLFALGGEETGLALIQYLEETLKIIQTCGAGRDRIRFALDPLSEYLAGLHLLDEYAGDEESWRKFLIAADEQEGSPEAIKGFILALRDCCLSKGEDAGVPDFLADELARRAGVNTEDKKKARLERRIRRLVQDLKLSDPEERAEAAKELGKLKGDAEAAIQALIVALKDKEYSVCRNAARALGEIGPAAEPAVPALIEALSNQVFLARIYIIKALGRIGPRAKQAVPVLIELSKDQSGEIRGSATEALKKIGYAPAHSHYSD